MAEIQESSVLFSRARRDREALQVKAARPAAPQAPKKTECFCREGDPMCGCLP
ncbi:hypothetical protein [Sorangium sp. So ce363]|uniref:hypothetical protein n=1 Tax=Sorangium sp. So ce363 TaxID=3133304 RepID=UPI003F61D05E